MGNRFRGRNCRQCSLKGTSWQELAILFRLRKIMKIDPFDNMVRTDKKTYKVDIKIPNRKLIVEFDGEYYHRNRLEKDIEKTKVLKSLGWQVVRVRELPLIKVRGCSVMIKPLNKFTDQASWLNNAMSEILEFMTEKKYISSKEQKIADKASNNGDLLEFYTKHKKDRSDSIKITQPTLMKYWEYEKNNDIDPGKLTKGSNVRVSFKCNKASDHRWSTSVTDFKGCPFCSRSRVCKSNSLKTTHPRIAQLWHPSRNKGLTPGDVMSGTNKKAWWKCERGHDFQKNIYVMTKLKSNPCPECNSISVTHPLIADEWHPTKNKGLTPKDVSKSSEKVVWWRCENGHEYKKAVSYRTDPRNSLGSKCQQCDLAQNSLQAKSPEIAKWWHVTRNNKLTAGEVKPTSRKEVWWQCPNGHEFKKMVQYMTGECKKCKLSIHSEVTYKGKKYSSYIALGKTCGISAKTILARIRLGWNINRAVETPTRDITYRGQKYPSLKKLAQKHGVGYDALKYRIKKGISLASAIRELSG